MLGLPARHLPEAQAGVEKLFIHSLLLHFFDYFVLAIIKSCVTSQGQGGCRLVTLPADANTLGIPVSSSVFEDLFLWQRLAVIFMVEGAEILAGARVGFGGR